MEEVLFKLNPWWEAQYTLDALPRDNYVSKLEKLMENKQIILLSGLRRVGKTTLLKIIVEKLLKTISPKHIFYVTLDAYGLDGYSIHDIVSEYRKIHKLPLSQKVYLFLDEITKKNNFVAELKDFYDNENVKIIASSSSTSLLKDNKAFLTGRTRLIEVLPLTFKEFLVFKSVKPKKSEPFLYEQYFKEYMEMGGIPEYILTGDPEYVIQLVDDILQKDIIAHYNVRNHKLVYDLFKLLCERAGKPMTYNKLANVLESNVDTIKRYIGYFENAYLVYLVEKYSSSLNERVKSPKKVYIGDVGIRNLAVDFKGLGSIYENLVYLKIKANKPYYVKENGVEIDFFYNDTLIECKYDGELTKKQEKFIRSHSAKNKVIVLGVDFFKD